jgi:hypothetical protein
MPTFWPDLKYIERALIIVSHSLDAWANMAG